MQRNNAYIITGAPGVGKTTLIHALQKQAVQCIEEPARQIIIEQRLIQGDGESVPFLRAFCCQCNLPPS